MRKQNNRKSNRQAHLGFRADQRLHALVDAEARRRGVAASEFLRQAVEAELAKEDPADQGLDPKLVALAATGRVDAQRAIAQLAMGWANDPSFPQEQVFAVAEFAARLAAAHGDPSDFLYLAGILMHRANKLATSPREEELLMAQAIELVNRAADMGHGPATEHLSNAKLLGVPNEIFELAANIQDCGLSEVVCTAEMGA
ncbi:hypothetical protein [Sphingomonas jatrophae]|uniref:Ribbon-helix-helix protein, copG family n=1 Tax=Sphingomonas jatrophae TaxID=1166337 RepID=A0A1I6L2D2_9SPHN|nr:hypothetical protein [Sphingomonas jatrophae]SFR97602.1 hypothetical protein SAMN05192580_2184 [Sphingomonas jatrophae]